MLLLTECDYRKAEQKKSTGKVQHLDVNRWGHEKDARLSEVKEELEGTL